MHSKVIIRILATSGILLAVATTYPSAACGYHGSLGDGFSASHPKSIDVAIAIRQAADDHLLDREILAPSVKDFLALHRATQRLKNLRDLLQPRTDIALTPAFSVLLVESALWSRYSVKGDKLIVDVHTNAPSPGEPVLVTGSAVLTAINAGRMTLERAVHRGLIAIDGSPDLSQSIGIDVGMQKHAKSE